MMKHHFRKIAILAAILVLLIAACGPQETATPEPTDVPTDVPTEEPTEVPTEEAADEDAEATEEADADAGDGGDVEATEEADMEATEEADMEATEEADMEATEEADMEATEEADMEATEEADMEATEEADMEATEEADMEATEEPDMGEDGIVSFDDEAGFTFDYPAGYELAQSDNGVTLSMGDLRLVVISPTAWDALVRGERVGQDLEQQLTFLVRRIGYDPGETAEMSMAAASISIELPRRGLVGYANLIDLGDEHYAVVIELGPDADSVPGEDGAVISGSMVFFVPQIEPIAIGDTISASLETGDRVSYELTLAEGDVVNIYLNGLDGLDTYLRVYDAEGSLIAENDDLNGVSSGLEGFSVDGGGVVTVEAGTYDDAGAGDIELVVEVASDEADAEEDTADDAEATEEADADAGDDAEATEEADADDADAEEEAGDDGDMEEAALPTILGLALNTEDLSTLTSAAVGARLTSTLNSEGSFTVFAPNNEAFAAALEAMGITADDLLADREALASILTYHVVDGAVLSGDLTDGMEVETLNGATLTIGVTDDGVTVSDGTNTYNVIAADIMASNGVVHVIDGVLMPPADGE